jgi:hypothetical protein
MFGYAGLVQSDPPGLNLRRPPSLPPDGGRPLSGPRRRTRVSSRLLGGPSGAAGIPYVGWVRLVRSVGPSPISAPLRSAPGNEAEALHTRLFGSEPRSVSAGLFLPVDGPLGGP